MVTAHRVHRSARVRRTLSRSRLQARLAWHRANGNAGPLLLQFKGRDRVGQRGLRQRCDTEWYPRASRVEPRANRYAETLHQANARGGIAWDSVTLAPN